MAYIKQGIRLGSLTKVQAAYDMLAEAGVPVVAVDDALEANGEKLAPWVGIDGYTIGETNGYCVKLCS